MTDFEIQLFTTQREEIITEREAMKALNLERMERGQALAYGEDAFMELVDRLIEIEEQIRNS